MYELAYVRNLNNELVGYIILKRVNETQIKVQGNFVYTVDELQDAIDMVNSRNEADIIRQNWPANDDSEVEALLADLSFEPDGAKYESTVIDPEASDLVMEIDGDGNELIDFSRSNVVYKTSEQELPSSTAERIHKACEVIAKRRSGIRT